MTLSQPSAVLTAWTVLRSNGQELVIMYLDLGLLIFFQDETGEDLELRETTEKMLITSHQWGMSLT